MASSVYATLSDLASYIGNEESLPSDTTEQQRLLDRAADLMDTVLLHVRFTVDTNGVPTDATVLAGLKNACCAQVEWWVSIGDELRSADRFSSVSMGPLRMQANATRSSGGNARSAEGDLAPRARDELARAGLLGRPQVW